MRLYDDFLLCRAVGCYGAFRHSGNEFLPVFRVYDDILDLDKQTAFLCAGKALHAAGLYKNDTCDSELTAVMRCNADYRNVRYSAKSSGQ